MGYFPYTPRPFQLEASNLVAQVARSGGHVALEMPTGTGKTAVLLAGALEAAEGTPRRILYVTRTNGQQQQAVRELIAIRAATGRPLRCYPLQGRSHLCLKLEDERDEDLEDSSPEELSHFCSRAKALTESDPASPRACSYFSGLQRRSDDDILALTGDQPLASEEFKTIGREHGFCSYEATKRLLPRADVVVAPYVFAFDPGLRRRLLEWWGADPADVILIVDEAHNLPGFLRELHSPRLSRDLLRRAAKEVGDLRNPLILPDMTAASLVDALDESLQRIVAEYCKGEDGFVPPFELESDLLGRFRLTTSALLQAADHLANLGEIIKERRRLQGRVPRSSLARLSGFLRHWISSDEEGYVKLAVREPRAYLEAFLVDAARAAETLASFHASIHASGTLAPLAEYRDALGLPEETRLERFPSPFPPQRLQVRVARGLTTKYERIQTDPALVDRLQEATRLLVSRMRVSGAVFFPSHQLLQDFREVGVFPPTGPTPLVESRDLSQESFMRLVQAHRQAKTPSVLAGVLGGRLSEGMDFPGRQLEAVVVVGAPYPKPTAHQRALFHYFESRFGRGWEYVVKAPTLRRLRQALGRLIRSPEDRGFAVILDERAGPLLAEAGVAHEVRSAAEIASEFEAWQRADSEGRYV